MARGWMGAVGVAIALGCGPAVGGSGETGGTDESGDPTLAPTTVATTAMTTTPTTTVDPTTATSSTTSTTTSTTESTTNDCNDECDCCDFICPPQCETGLDGTGPWNCDLWEQDCPPGEKCMPWANDGGDLWNALRCSPVEGDAGQPGEPCTVEGSYVSGIDTCMLGAMCFWVDPKTNAGTCVAQCGGSEANPTCDAENELCVIELEGHLNVCLPRCDPLQQDCPAGAGCFRYGTDFVCGDAIEPTGGPDVPCDFEWRCAPGSLCVAAELLPACDGDACCTGICDTEVPEACGPERVCLPLHENDGSNAGYCALP